MVWNRRYRIHRRDGSPCQLGGAAGLYPELRNELGMKGASGVQLSWTFQKRISMRDVSLFLMLNHSHHPTPKCLMFPGNPHDCCRDRHPLLWCCSRRRSHWQPLTDAFSLTGELTWKNVSANTPPRSPRSSAMAIGTRGSGTRLFAP